MSLPGFLRSVARGSSFRSVDGDALRVDDDDLRHARDQADRNEVGLDRVVELRIHRRRDRVVHRAHEERVAVGRGLGGDAGADGAAGAAAVVDDHLPAEVARQHRGERPRERVGAAAGGEGNDEGHRPVRPAALRAAPAASRRAAASGGAGGGETAASAGRGRASRRDMESSPWMRLSAHSCPPCRPRQSGPRSRRRRHRVCRLGRTAFCRRITCQETKWSEKRERQYEHIKESLKERGKNEDTAEEIAARTVNKERARHGESETASPTSVERHLLGPARRPALAQRRRRPHPRPALAEAAKTGIKGRSKMNKAQLERAVGR